MRLTELLHHVKKYDFLIERDVLNARELKAWVNEISGRVLSPLAQRWFKSQLFQYLINRYEDSQNVKAITQVPENAPDWIKQKLAGGEALYEITVSPAMEQDIMSVIDYINNWSEENAKHDKDGNVVGYREPRMRFEQAIEQAEEWHKEMKNVTVSAEENKKDLEEVVTIYQFKNGYRWVDVRTEACLKREGSRMGHCVGGYGPHVAAGTTKIFSLRNNKNYPHATIEAISDEPTVITGIDNAQMDMFGGGGRLPPLKIEQVKGRSNKPPVAKYIPYVKEFLEWGNFEMGRGVYDINNMGLYLKNGKYLTLKEASRPVKQYKDGTKWVMVDPDVTREYYGPPYHLVDKDYNIIVTINTSESDGKLSSISKSDNTSWSVDQLRPKILDIVNHIGIEDSSWYMRTLNGEWGIYGHNGKYGALHDVAEKQFDMKHGFKSIKAGKNNYVLNDKNKIVFQYTTSEPSGTASISKNSIRWDNLDTNLADLMRDLAEKNEGGLSTKNFGEAHFPEDIDGKPLVQPSGKPVYETKEISWYNGIVPSNFPDTASKENTFVAFDKHGNPRYWLELEDSEAPSSMYYESGYPEKKVIDLGGINGAVGSENNFKPGEQILDIIIDENWEVEDDDVKEKMYEDYGWIVDEYGDWWKADDKAPVNFTYKEWDENGDEVQDTEQAGTLQTFWDETSLKDSGLEAGWFIREYADFFNGNPMVWEEQDREHEIEDPETGGYRTEYYSSDYGAEFTGNKRDYKHPKQS